MKITPTKIPGVVIIEQPLFSDERGFFQEVFREDRFKEAGLIHHFPQDNHSRSIQYTLRGLHFQKKPKSQAKLVRVTEGCVFDVAVDIRKESPTYKQWVGVELSSENKKMLYIPGECAHGFLTLSETAELQYKCSDIYSKEHEGSIHWEDPQLNISWPLPKEGMPIVSKKDAEAPYFSDV
jgi:dTDP-4-dehydrorhamnose 3,5-epimerase